MAKPKVPEVEGWFVTDGAPHLLGSLCAKCGTYFFPKESFFCRNPGCAGTEFETVPLSRKGKLWSYSTNHYQPPAPYVSPDPFVPYTVAAVELERERMVVLGKVADGVEASKLKVGMEMELIIEPLYEDAEAQHLVWKWRPV